MISRTHRDKSLQLTVLLTCLLLATCEIQYPSIQWTPSNPIFGSADTRLCVLPRSKIHFVCPNPSTILRRVEMNVPKNELYENIWFVNKTSYENCKVDMRNRMDRLVTTCSEPLLLRYVTVVFQLFSADKGLIFTPGQEYYFIATSDGSQQSINRTSGGHCRSQNMKLKVYVCEGENDPLCQEKYTPTKVNEKTQPTVASRKNARTQSKLRNALKCYACHDCGSEHGEEEMCHHSDLNVCLWKSCIKNGRQVITRTCGNTSSCTREQEACQTNNCEVLCCNSNLCNIGPASASSQLSIPCLLGCPVLILYLFIVFVSM